MANGNSEQGPLRRTGDAMDRMADAAEKASGDIFPPMGDTLVSVKKASDSANDAIAAIRGGRTTAVISLLGIPIITIQLKPF